MELKIGADPEFFVRKRSHFISGHIFNLGDKKKPMETTHGSVQCDGIALEVNVRPATSKDDFIRNLRNVSDDLVKLVRAKEPSATIVPRPTIYFGNQRLSKLPVSESGDGPAILGCTPDFDAYTQSQRPSPDGNQPIRTGAGHIHLGWTNVVNPRSVQHFNVCCALVKELDYFLGLPSLLWDKDTRRRKLYGQAGSFRPKPYGLEYRVLSNKWCESTGLIGYVFDQAKKAYDRFQSGQGLAEHYGNFAADCINRSTDGWRTITPGLAKELLA